MSLKVVLKFHLLANGQLETSSDCLYIRTKLCCFYIEMPGEFLSKLQTGSTHTRSEVTVQQNNAQQTSHNIKQNRCRTKSFFKIRGQTSLALFFFLFFQPSTLGGVLSSPLGGSALIDAVIPCGGVCRIHNFCKTLTKGRQSPRGSPRTSPALAELHLRG